MKQNTKLYAHTRENTTKLGKASFEEDFKSSNEGLLQMDLSHLRRRLVQAFFEDGFKFLKDGLLVFLQRT